MITARTAAAPSGAAAGPPAAETPGPARDQQDGDTANFLTAEELLAGADLEFDVEIPVAILRPDEKVGDDEPHPARRVRLRPLRLKDVQLIARAAHGDEVLTSVLMIQRALVEPELDQHAVSRLSSGLVAHLVDRINRISGISSTDDEIRDMAGSPIVQTFFVLAREFGWTPDEIRALTVGQVLGYLEMLNRSRRVPDLAV